MRLLNAVLFAIVLGLSGCGKEEITYEKPIETQAVAIYEQEYARDYKEFGSFW